MKLLCCGIAVLIIVSGAAVAQQIELDPSGSWLLDSKRVSMHHSVGFFYGSHARSYQSLYANSIRYVLSPKLTLTGTFGYTQYGSKYSSYKSLLHGFGIRYHPSQNFKIQFHYLGSSPFSQPTSLRRSSSPGNR
jgi:hypothetical protein